MSPIQTIIILLFLPHVGVLAQAAVDPSADKNDFVMCRNQKVIRTIRINQVQDDSTKKPICVTTYTKSGVDKEVGRASNYNSCEKILGNIKANLETANWKCKAVGNATFTQEKIED